MRSLITAAALALALTACATQTTPPAAAPTTAAVPAPVTAATAPAPKAPECYNGDAGKFEAVGTVSAISGVKVVCEKTSDGKNAQWMGVKK
jgi:hypothetical protein